MRVLVTGAAGQVGRALLARQWPAGWNPRGATRAEFDVTAPSPRIEADLVVNCAAYTAVDKAESEPEAARATNAVAPGRLAEACAKAGARLIHISTDYVFDGTKPIPYVEDDPVNPLSVYGATKEAGERAVRAASSDHVILRTTWVYDAVGANFPRTMLRLFKERARLTVVDDQRGAPTSAADIADAIVALAATPDARGTFHFTAAGEASWYAFACLLRDRVGASTEITPIPTSEYPTPATRPMNSRLDCAKIETSIGIVRRPWRDAVDQVLKEMGL